MRKKKLFHFRLRKDELQICMYRYAHIYTHELTHVIWVELCCVFEGIREVKIVMLKGM